MACGTIRWRRYVDASAQSEDQIDVLSLPTFEIFPQWDPIDEVYGVTDMHAGPRPGIWRSFKLFADLVQRNWRSAQT